MQVKEDGGDRQYLCIKRNKCDVLTIKVQINCKDVVLASGRCNRERTVLVDARTRTADCFTACELLKVCFWWDFCQISTDAPRGVRLHNVVWVIAHNNNQTLQFHNETLMHNDRSKGLTVPSIVFTAVVLTWQHGSMQVVRIVDNQLDYESFTKIVWHGHNARAHCPLCGNAL